MKSIFSLKSRILVLLLMVGLALQAQDSIKYLFVSHCYQRGSHGKRVDYRIEKLDKSVYEGVWLGGDVCSEAMLEYSTVQYIDSVFHLGSPETHWTLGNHDARNGNWEWYTEFVGHKTYYAHTSHDITRIVMNTNIVPAKCEMLNDEYQMISNVCDTISESKYLVLLMHHGIWLDIPGLPHPGNYAQSILKYWNANCDSVDTPFSKTIYPKLVEVKNRGIEVICIIGDMGSGPKKFEKDSDDGIHFLGCGLFYNEPDNNVLTFTYDIPDQKLSWQFDNLDSLLNVQKVP